MSASIKVVVAVVVIFATAFALFVFFFFRRPINPIAPEGIANFRSVSTATRTTFGPIDLVKAFWQARIQVGGTVKTETGAFPASLYMWPPCSATLIGEHVLLTAEHCMTDGRTRASVELADGQISSGECEMHRIGDPKNPTIDMALCLLEKPLTDLAFESLASDSHVVKDGDEVLLTGFGVNQQHPKAFLTGATNVRTIDGSVLVTSDKAWFTDGDSGGAVYKIFNKYRRILAVNSRVRDLDSFATLVAHSAVKSIITDWQARATATLNKKVFICGYDTNPVCQP